MSPPYLTTRRTLAAGPVLRRGVSAPYHGVVVAGGEPHQVRDDLVATAGPPAAGRPVACLVHVTDLQLADVQSPARFEFLNRYFTDPRYAKIVPVQRPQEALTAHAIDATIRTINAVTGPATSMTPQLVVTTGDAIDNAQWNEVLAFLALLDGGTVRFGATAGSGAARSGAAGSGGAASGGYHGVQARDWPDDIFWRPDGDGRDGPDLFRRELGFPHHPGLLDRALREFTAPGLRIPWLSCFGNHEALSQGVGVQTPDLAVALTGGRKPTALPDDFDHDRALEYFTERPEVFMSGPTLPVPADPGRRPLTRAEFVDAHFRPGARPAGHGFTERNRRDGTAYYAYDAPGVRLIALDTACLAGGADGCIDADQARWLEASLTDVHSAYRAPDGSLVRTGNDDRLVVVFSHHGAGTLTNTRCAASTLAGADLLALLHRFGNVVLWLNGHTHINAITPHRDPAAPGRGFWEVTTCAVADWPSQTRLVELTEAGGELAITCTMIDHQADLIAAEPRAGGPRAGGPRAGGPGTGLPQLAALHRELAANVPFFGAGSALAGALSDRNVVLRLPAPFPLAGLRP